MSLIDLAFLLLLLLESSLLNRHQNSTDSHCKSYQPLLFLINGNNKGKLQYFRNTLHIQGQL